MKLEGSLRERLENLLDEISHTCLPEAVPAKSSVQSRARLQVNFQAAVMAKIDLELECYTSHMRYANQHASVTD